LKKTTGKRNGAVDSRDGGREEGREGGEEGGYLKLEQFSQVADASVGTEGKPGLL